MNNKKLNGKQAGKIIVKILRDRNMRENNKDFERFMKTKLLTCAFCNKKFEADKDKSKSVVNEYKKSGKLNDGYYVCPECDIQHEISKYNYSKFKMNEKQIRILFSTFLDECDKLEKEKGKFIVLENLQEACSNATKKLEPELRITPEMVSVALQILITSGDFFIPRKGFLQRI